MNRLKEAREEKGLSQLRLSFLTGISPWDLSRLEHGWLKPYPNWRKRLSKALGKSEQELFPEE
jgi:putative transcriptional regulator